MTNKETEEEKSQCCGAIMSARKQCMSCLEFSEPFTPEEAGKGAKCHCGNLESHKFRLDNRCPVVEFGCKCSSCTSLPQHKEEATVNNSEINSSLTDKDSWQETLRKNWHEWDMNKKISFMESIRTEGIEEEREQFLEMIYRMEATKWNDISKERDNFNEGWNAACRNARSPQDMQPKELKK